MKISVITWNGNFRESFHTVDFFAQQSIAREEFEFIWVEYYDAAADELVEKIDRVDNARIVYLKGQGQWHAGRCMNAGIAASSGELLVIVDGDVVPRPKFLENIWQAHQSQNKSVIYVRRWDEPEKRKGPVSLPHLEDVCWLGNPTNYGGGISIDRKAMQQVKGYEEHPVFGGPGAVSKELYTRLRNLGLPIIWHPTEKLFHPWHKGTLPSTDTTQRHKQDWVIKQREHHLDIEADQKQVQIYLEQYNQRNKSHANVDKVSEKIGGEGKPTSKDETKSESRHSEPKKEVFFSRQNDDRRSSNMHNVIILGSGRSGTSMTAGLLAQAGYFMGVSPNPTRLSNPKGQFEDRDINLLNEDILAPITESFGQGQRWLARIPIDTAIPTSPDLETRIQELTRQSPFCFKDPRFSYTLPIWKPFLTNTVFVCVFRDPASTALSMLKHAARAEHLQGFSLSFADALEVWILMYRHILEKHRHQGDWLFLHFDQVLEQAGQKRLAAFTQAVVDETFPEPDLRRSYSDHPVPPDTQKVYEQLCELASYDHRPESIAARAAPPPDFRVSVVITSYNQKPYLVEAIESVIHQTLKPYEIIIADDGSTDGQSVACIKDYMARYPGWIKGVFQQGNVGIPKNRNAGLRAVTGNYVAILDGDDRFLPDKLEKEWAALQQEPEAKCIYSNVRLIDSEGQSLGVRDQQVQPSGDIFVEIARGKFGLLRSMVINYNLLKHVGVMDELLPMYDGFELTLRLAKQGQFVYISIPLVEYRVHPASATKRLKLSHHFDELQTIFAKVEPLLDDLPKTEQIEIDRDQQSILVTIMEQYVKDSQTPELQAEISELTHPIVLAFLERTIRSKELIERQQAHLAEQRERLKAIDTQIERQQAHLAEQRERLKAKNIQIINLNERLMKLEEAYKCLNHDMNIILASKSWKLTAPLRGAAEYLRKLKNN